MVEYIIVGDTERFNDCLVTVVKGDMQRAEERLEQMLTAPTPNDKILIGNCKNLRIKESAPEKAWWNDPFLAN